MNIVVAVGQRWIGFLGSVTDAADHGDTGPRGNWIELGVIEIAEIQKNAIGCKLVDTDRRIVGLGGGECIIDTRIGIVRGLFVPKNQFRVIRIGGAVNR